MTQTQTLPGKDFWVDEDGRRHYVLKAETGRFTKEDFEERRARLTKSAEEDVQTATQVAFHEYLLRVAFECGGRVLVEDYGFELPEVAKWAKRGADLLVERLATTGKEVSK